MVSGRDKNLQCKRGLAEKTAKEYTLLNYWIISIVITTDAWLDAAYKVRVLCDDGDDELYLPRSGIIPGLLLCKLSQFLAYLNHFAISTAYSR